MSRIPRSRNASLRLAAIALASVAAGGAAAAGSLVAQGKAIADKQCSRCHVVDQDNPFSGIASTPSFHLLVTAFPDWRERFETFYARRPHPAVIRFEGVAPITDEPPTTATVNLKLEDVDAIVAFAAHLKEEADKAK